MLTITKKAKQEFLKNIKDFGSDPFVLESHVNQAEAWAFYMLKKYPQADQEVALLSVWLHDIGHYPIPTEVDQAVRSEERAKEFLAQKNYDPEKPNKSCMRFGLIATKTLCRKPWKQKL